MSTDATGKRPGAGGTNSRKRKRQRYKQYSSTTQRRDLGKGTRGFLISCTPKHEAQCFRDAVILLSEHVDVDALTAEQPPVAAVGGGDPSPPAGPAAAAGLDAAASAASGAADSGGAGGGSGSEIPGGVGAAPAAAEAADVSSSLNAELSALRGEEQTVFTRVDAGVSGSIFVRVDDARVDLEGVAESILARAQRTGAPGCRFCIRIVPVHSTCYANAADAAAAAVGVVAHAFPPGPASFAIQFRARVNAGAHRDEYITAIAAAIEREFPSRFKVNLTAPDVVLIVEVVKTSCCIGSFRRYFELGKMNIREACKPRKKPAAKEGGRGVGNDAACADGVQKSGTVASEEKREADGAKGEDPSRKAPAEVSDPSGAVEAETSAKR